MTRNYAPTSSRKRLVAEVVIYGNIAWILGVTYVAQLNAFLGESQVSWFGRESFVFDIASGNGDDPYRWRLLIPLTVVGLDFVDNRIFDVTSISEIQMVSYFMCFLAYLLGIRFMMTSYGYSKNVAFGSGIAGGLLLIPMFGDHGYQAWSWLDLALIPAAVLLVRLRPQWIAAFALLVLIGSLNRETSLLLPLVPLSAYLVTRGEPRSRALLRLTIVSALVAVGVAVFLRTIWPGPAAERVMDLEEILRMNTEGGAIGMTFMNLAMVFGALLILAAYATFKGWAPPMAQVTALTVGGSTIAIWLVFALWWEVRVLGPLLVVMLPVAMAGIFGPAPSQRVQAST